MAEYLAWPVQPIQADNFPEHVAMMYGYGTATCGQSGAKRLAVVEGVLADPPWRIAVHVEHVGNAILVHKSVAFLAHSAPSNSMAYMESSSPYILAKSICRWL